MNRKYVATHSTISVEVLLTFVLDKFQTSVHVSTNRTRQVRISRKEWLYTNTPAFCNMATHDVPHDAVQRPYHGVL